jgi:hypothetical protein
VSGFFSLFFGKPKSPKSKIDKTIIEPSVRGTICPLTWGVNRVTPIIGYVGDVKITTTSVKMGKGGGGGGVKTNHYHMVGMHILSTGPGIELTAILQAGKNILKTNNGQPFIMKPDTFSSGSEVTLGNSEGTFRIYWGGEHERDINFVDERLAALTGVASKYPNIFYIVWDRKLLGEQKTWPQLDYEIFVAPKLWSSGG